MINETIEIVAQYIAMYAPTVLTALGVVATYVKVFIGLKSNADNIMNNPKMVALKDEELWYHNFLKEYNCSNDNDVLFKTIILLHSKEPSFHYESSIL